MRYVANFVAILMVGWLFAGRLGVTEETLLEQDEVRMCANGKRSYFGYCPEDVQKDQSRPPPGYSAPKIVVKRKRRPVNAGDCDASRPPEGGENPCPPKRVSTVPAVTTNTGNLISGRYRDNGDGTVTDVTTNLMWKRCSEGQTWTGSTCAGEAIGMTWNNAMPNAQQKSWASFAGRSDWRMPSREELRSLVYCSSGDPKTWNDIINDGGYDGCNGEYQKPTIDQTAFPNTPAEWFLTSSPDAADSSSSWLVVFGYGDVSYGLRYSDYAVRLVRSGQ